MRVILLTKDGRHFVLSGPAYGMVAGDDVMGPLATGGQVRVPLANYAAQEIYQDAEIEMFRMRLREVEAAAVAREQEGNTTDD